ncbi:formyl peptide receptor-related sequence 7 [Hydra vulgaris]|uniref:formyl peptide receptor-related sequence 7 n=1 Tax=Hydra vulgaris TaxID=6087 RepID=UPI001F5E41C3|nr:formyl peptide receptor-related sequence 7-like [Hydra vulgaris]
MWHLVIRSTFYAFFFIFGLVGNIFVISLYIFKMKQSHFRWLVIHHALSDTLWVTVSFMHILHLLFNNGKWNIGVFMCKFITFIGPLTVNVSAWILCLMGYERYRAICNPFSRRFSRKIIHKSVAVCWVICIGLNFVLIWRLNVVDGKCYPVFKSHTEYVLNVSMTFMANSVIPIVLLFYYLLCVVVTFRKRAIYINNIKRFKSSIIVGSSIFHFNTNESIEIKPNISEKSNFNANESIEIKPNALEKSNFNPNDFIEIKPNVSEKRLSIRGIPKTLERLSTREAIIPESELLNMSCTSGPTFDSSETTSSVTNEKIKRQVVSLSMHSVDIFQPNEALFNRRNKRHCVSNYDQIPSENFTSAIKLPPRSNSCQNYSTSNHIFSLGRASTGSFPKYEFSANRSSRTSITSISRRRQSMQNLLIKMNKKKDSFTEIANIRIKDLRDRATVNILLFTAVVFFLSTFPYTAFDIVISILQKDTFIGVGKSECKTTLEVVKEWLYILLLSRSVMNVFINCGKFSYIYQYANKLLRCTQRHSNQSVTK